MKKEDLSPGMVMIKLHKSMCSLTIGMISNFWEKTEKVVSDVLAQNSWCPAPVGFIGKWAESSKNCCNALKEKMMDEFDHLEKFLGERKTEQKPTHLESGK